jgi:hypothetical protein
MSERQSPTVGDCAGLREHLRCEAIAAGERSAHRAAHRLSSAGLFAQASERYVAKTCQNSRVAPYEWTVREGSLDGPVVMREYVYDVPEKEPVEGQELYLSNGSGPWRVMVVEMVPELPRSPYNILVVESVY